MGMCEVCAAFLLQTYLSPSPSNLTVLHAHLRTDTAPGAVLSMRCVCIKGQLQEVSASPLHMCTSCLISHRLDNSPIFGGLRCVNLGLTCFAFISVIKTAESFVSEITILFRSFSKVLKMYTFNITFILLASFGCFILRGVSNILMPHILKYDEYNFCKGLQI